MLYLNSKSSISYSVFRNGVKFYRLYTNIFKHINHSTIAITINKGNQIMEDLLKNDEFTQFILNQYFKESTLTDREKIEFIGESLEHFTDAIQSFKLSASKSGRH